MENSLTLVKTRLRERSSGMITAKVEERLAGIRRLDELMLAVAEDSHDRDKLDPELRCSMYFEAAHGSGGAGGEAEAGAGAAGAGAAGSGAAAAGAGAGAGA